MKISLAVIAIFSLICVNAYGQDERKVTSANANDYVDCAAFYASVLASVTIMGNADKEKTDVLKERVNFYLKTATIYSGSGSLTADMQNRFLSKNKEYSSGAYRMLKDSDKEIYPKYVDSRANECKDMLNVNMMPLLEKQGVEVK